MRWRRRHTVGVVVVVLGTAFYVYFIHRSVQLRDAEGWHLRFSFQPFHCPVCLGRVEELSHEGHPVPIPDWGWETDGRSTPVAIIHTPVGDFRAFEESARWLPGSTSALIEEAAGRIAPEELVRGWYDARKPEAETWLYGPYLRKRDTPADWCLLATYDQARWVRPDVISELEW